METQTLQLSKLEREWREKKVLWDWHQYLQTCQGIKTQTNDWWIRLTGSIL